MTKAIEIVKLPRVHLLDVVKDLSIEQLNHIPEGFNNNIIWNLAHIVATQQNICYKRAGLDITIEERFFTPFLSGTKPEKFIDAADVEIIKGLFFSTLDQLEADLHNGKFTSYTSWTTRYGNAINSGEEAVAFLPFHEGLHTGYIWALKRLAP
ncbi:DinB family protein [Mucilaginibacter corticis]|uniref:DinB family protein n=1 Tax=Mucilaginibacter corticis TaxID=2597670 RepID=A0A556MS61_9SPHI|nr:DinB family protein [Mucilaginibacter corticis]TSJ42662.1 DinB family protein [Mucilaginibacter corticis]